MLTTILKHKHKGEAKRADGGGFTLIEVVVALVLLGIIIVPLTAAFIQGIRRTSEIDKRLGRSGDLQRISSWWTRDVGSVNPTGINAPDKECPDPAAATSPSDTALLTFSWDDNTGDAGTPKSASWVVEGSGADAKLVRRYCEGGAPISEATLADSFGVAGLPALSLVSDKLGGTANFCDSLSCTIKVSGAYAYTLTADRRVAGSATSDSPPPPPEIIDASTSNQTVVVSWNPSLVTTYQSAVTDYQAALFTTSNCSGSVVVSATLDGNSSSATLTGASVINGTNYYACVKAKNDAGYGPFGPGYGPLVTTFSPPNAPTNVVGTGADSTASVTWTEPSNTGGTAITGYIVYVNDGTSDTEYSTSTKPFQLPDGVLINNKPYTFAVKAINNSGPGTKSAYSAPVRPFGTPLGIRAPGAVLRQDATMLIFWDRIAEPETSWCNPQPADEESKYFCVSNGSPVTEYLLRVEPADSGTAAVAGSPFTVTQPVIASPTTSNSRSAVSFTTPALQLGGTYNFSITPRNAGGYGDSTGFGPSAIIVAPTAVGLPSIYQNGNSGQLDFVIPPPSSNGGAALTSYVVTESSGRTATVTPASSGNTTFTWSTSTATGTALSDFTSYSFTIKACNPQQCSPESPSYQAVPAPLGVAANVSVSNSAPGTATLGFSYAAGKGMVPSALGQTEYVAFCGSVFAPNGNFADANPISLTIAGLPVGTQTCSMIVKNRTLATVGGAPSTVVFSGPTATTSIDIYTKASAVGAPTVTKPATGPVTSLTVVSPTTNPYSGGSNPAVEFRATCGVYLSPWTAGGTMTVSGIAAGLKNVTCTVQVRPTQRATTAFYSDQSPASSAINMQRVVPYIEAISGSKGLSQEDGAQSSNANKMFVLLQIRTDPGISVLGLRCSLSTATSGVYIGSPVCQSGANSTSSYQVWKTETVGNDLRTYVLVTVTPPNGNWAGIGSTRAITKTAAFSVQVTGPDNTADASLPYWVAYELNSAGPQDYPVAYDTAGSTATLTNQSVGSTITAQYSCDDNDGSGSNDDECDAARIRIRNLVTGTAIDLVCANKQAGSDASCETRSGATNGAFNADDGVNRKYNMLVPAGTGSGLWSIEVKYCNEDGACPSSPPSGYGGSSDTDYETIGYFPIP